jgi:murein DD-endopeptidase MepM/ murein hydrolase activator NlpD
VRRPAAGPSRQVVRPRALEIQVHPADRCRRVRTLALGRPTLTLLSLLALGYLLFVAVGIALAPGVVRGLAGNQEYPAMAAERTRRGARLQELVRRLDALARRGERADLDLRRIERAYGLAPPAAGRRNPAIPGRDPSIYGGAVREGERLRARLGERLGAVERMLAAVERCERTSPERVRETPAAAPLRGRDFVLHAGLDLAAPAGTPVRAPAAGRVAFAGRLPPARGSRWWRLGNLVILVHGDRFATVLGHCASLAVKAGQTVRRGEVVATVGATGWAASPQLHYEVWRRGEGGAAAPVDPRLYMLDRRWPDEEQLLAADPGLRPGDYDPLPIPLGASPAGPPSRRAHRRR